MKYVAFIILFVLVVCCSPSFFVQKNSPGANQEVKTTTTVSADSAHLHVSLPEK